MHFSNDRDSGLPLRVDEKYDMAWYTLIINAANFLVSQCAPPIAVLSPDKYNKAMRPINKLALSGRVLTLSFLVLFLNCDIDIGTISGSTTKIYSGSFGYDVAYRIIDNKVYFGSYGYDVAYRIDGNKIYSGSYGYDVAYRLDGNKVYSGSYSYDVAYRIDGDKIYSGSFGYNVAYRVGR